MNTLRSFFRWIFRHRLISGGIALLLLVGIWGARTYLKQTSGAASTPVTRGNVVDAVYGIGTVTAKQSFSIKPGVTGTITALFVKEGDLVSSGAKLAQIDGVLYRAPFAGVVNYLPYQVGENVFATSPVLVLTHLQDRYLVVTLEQQGALRVKPGQTAKLSFDTLRGQSYSGKVESVYSYGGNFLARIDVSALPAEVLPDMTADVAIVVREIKDVLLIPVAALERGSVWVKRGRSLPKQTPVTLGIVDGAMAEVKSGEIEPGDLLMIRQKASQ